MVRSNRLSCNIKPKWSFCSPLPYKRTPFASDVLNLNFMKSSVDLIGVSRRFNSTNEEPLKWYGFVSAANVNAFWVWIMFHLSQSFNISRRSENLTVIATVGFHSAVHIMTPSMRNNADILSYDRYPEMMNQSGFWIPRCLTTENL